jgi:phosphoglycerate dehydrogenase-like enzyme
MTKETEGLFNMKLFKKMKPSAIFINCSRGVVVNQEDLCEALKTKTIAAAGLFLKNIFYKKVYIIFCIGLDVTTPEPLPKNHELYQLKNCFITPHIGTCDTKLRNKMFHITTQNILNGLHDQPLFSEIKHSST